MLFTILCDNGQGKTTNVCIRMYVCYHGLKGGRLNLRGFMIIQQTTQSSLVILGGKKKHFFARLFPTQPRQTYDVYFLLVLGGRIVFLFLRVLQQMQVPFVEYILHMQNIQTRLHNNWTQSINRWLLYNDQTRGCLQFRTVPQRKSPVKELQLSQRFDRIKIIVAYVGELRIPNALLSCCRAI